MQLLYILVPDHGGGPLGVEGGVLPGASYEKVDGVDCNYISRAISKASKVYKYRMYRNIIHKVQISLSRRSPQPQHTCCPIDLLSHAAESSLQSSVQGSHSTKLWAGLILS